jgi:GH24 family phage-related lysozyme (muramidase)
MNELITFFEGYRLTVYADSAGNPTVGVGHLVRPKDNLKLGDKITKEQADEFLRQDLIDAEKRVVTALKPYGYLALQPHELEVLISLAYNLTSFEKLAKHLGTSKQLFKKKMLEYYKTKGSERGLKRRRIAERLLFEGRDWLTVSKELDGKSLGQMMIKEKELFNV